MLYLMFYYFWWLRAIHIQKIFQCLLSGCPLRGWMYKWTMDRLYLMIGPPTHNSWGNHPRSQITSTAMGPEKTWAVTTRFPTFYLRFQFSINQRKPTTTPNLITLAYLPAFSCQQSPVRAYLKHSPFPLYDFPTPLSAFESAKHKWEFLTFVHNLWINSFFVVVLIGGFTYFQLFLLFLCLASLSKELILSHINKKGRLISWKCNISQFSKGSVKVYYIVSWFIIMVSVFISGF